MKPDDTGSQKTLPDFLREKPQFKFSLQVFGRYFSLCLPFRSFSLFCLDEGSYRPKDCFSLTLSVPGGNGVFYSWIPPLDNCGVSGRTMSCPHSTQKDGEFKLSRTVTFSSKRLSLSGDKSGDLMVYLLWWLLCFCLICKTDQIV